jgi:hypothetical protein
VASITRQAFLKWAGLLGLGLPTAARAEESGPGSGVVRRVVTGVDASRRSLIVKDAAAPHIYRRQAEGVVITELWSTDRMPSSNRGETDPTDSPLRLAPPANGSAFRILSFLPQTTSHVGPPAGDSHVDGTGISAALEKGRSSGRARGFTSQTRRITLSFSAEKSMRFSMSAKCY